MSAVQVLHSLFTRSRWSRRRLSDALIVAAGVSVAVACGGDGGGTGNTPDYTLALSSAALSILPGANQSTTVTIDRTSFTGEVTLSLGGAPAGVTGSFDPAAPTGNSSTLNVSVGAAVAPGVYHLNVNGTGSAGDRTTPLTLTVEAPADYALSLDHTADTIVQGGNGTAAVTITRTNFTGAVTLSLGGAPVGVTGAFAPAAPTGTTSTLTITVGAAVAPGNYNLTVDGTGTAGDRSTPITLTVTAAAADYSLSLSAPAFTVAPSSNGTTTVTIARTNFTGAVTLSLGGAPAGVTGAYAPAAPTGTTSTLTVTVGAAVAAGVYNLTVDGTGTAGNRSTPLTLTVSAAPSYNLAVAPDTITLQQGTNTGTRTVNIARSNFAGAVTLSLGGAPAGVTGAFAPPAPTTNTSTLTLTIGGAVAPGVYNLTVDGTGTAGNQSAPLSLTVTATPSYSLATAPDTLTIVQGANSTTAVTIARTNFTGAVTLSLTGAPAGVTGAFAPAAPTGTSSTLTVTVGAAVAAGTYPLTIDGAATAGAHSTPLVLVVTAAPADYALSTAPDSVDIVQGVTGTSTVTISRTNFTGAVTLSLGGAPASLTGTFAPAAPTGTTSTLTVTVGGAVAAGVYHLTINGTGTPGARSTPLTVKVIGAAANYALSLSSATMSVAKGANGTSTVTITRTNFTGAVTLSLGGAPAGVTGAFAPAAPTGTSSTLTVTVGSSVAAGLYHLTVDGTGTPGARSTPLDLTVTGGGGGGSVSIDVSACAVADRPVWLAFQDGSGPWTVTTPVSNVYHFTLATSKGGLAYVVLATGDNQTKVDYRTVAEATGAPIVICSPPDSVGKTIHGTATGLAATDQTFVNLGGAVAFATSLSSAYTLTGVANGTHDLVAYKHDLVGSNDGIIVRRDLNPVDGSTLAAMRFDSAEAKTPATGLITVAGLSGSETGISEFSAYNTGASCDRASLSSGAVAGTSFTAVGAPASLQRASDLNQVAVSAAETNASRFTLEYFHTMAAKTLTLGAAISVPTISTLTGPYKRLQAAFTVPAEYDIDVGFSYRETSSGSSIAINASPAYLGGTSATLAAPDFSALAGWDNTWAPTSAATGTWSAAGTGGTNSGAACVEGGTLRDSQRTGTF